MNIFLLFFSPYEVALILFHLFGDDNFVGVLVILLAGIRLRAASSQINNHSKCIGNIK